MKTISNTSTQLISFCIKSLSLKSVRHFSLAIIFALTQFIEMQAKAQSYIINYSGLNLHAQGLAYHPAQKRFIISSMKDGQLGYIDSEGQYVLFLKDSLLIGATGLKVKDEFLYVLTGNSVAPTQADIKTSEHIKLIKLNLLNKTIVSTYKLNKLHNGPHYISDLTIDKDGIVYITDALSPVIYKVNTDGATSVLLTNKLLNSQGSQHKAITYHENGYLLVAVNGDILKIDLANNNSISKVFVEEGFDDINSLHFTPNHLLILSEGGDSRKVHILNSSNSWVAANVLRTDTWNYNNPVNLDFVKNKIFVLDANTDQVSKVDFSVRVIDLKKYSSKKGRKVKIVVGDAAITKKGF